MGFGPFILPTFEIQVGQKCQSVQNHPWLVLREGMNATRGRNFRVSGLGFRG